MESLLEATASSNPWTRAPAHPLDVFLKANNLNKQTLLPQHQVDTDYAETTTAKQIALIKKMDELSSDVYEMKRKICKIKRDRDHHDLTRADSLEAKLNTVKRLCSDLEIILKNRDRLLSMLQTPYQGQHMKLEAKYHADAVELFTNIATSLSNFNEQCQVLKWSKKHDFIDERVSDSMRSLSMKISQLQQELLSTKSFRIQDVTSLALS
ncbi:unnamed protein product [Clavelina lepadiformis]|uniref:HAUS augmin-like complex subunit 2 n=1 Tax=Clavelina lepadiformis TaxID=159417 RepID=A0ABP0FWI5_CLALP